MLVAIGAVLSIKLREQRTTVLMLDFPFEAQFAVAVTKRLCKLLFQSGETGQEGSLRVYRAGIVERVLAGQSVLNAKKPPGAMLRYDGRLLPPQLTSAL